MYTELKEPLRGYFVNENGVVISRKTKFSNYEDNHIMSQRINKYGYYDVGLRFKDENGIKRKRPFEIHRLMAKTFIPNPNNLPCVNHIDGDKLNNKVNNLEWCTVRYNTKHAADNGKIPQQKGQNNKTAKLSDFEIPEIMILRASKMTVKEIAKEYGVAKSTIQNITSGYQWNHITGLPCKKDKYRKPLGNQSE